jgi:hypothetical protein
MEHYYKTQLNMNRMVTEVAPINNDSILSEFDRYWLILLLGQKDGWQAELCRYLKDMPTNVMKDKDIVEWWQVCS